MDSRVVVLPRDAVDFRNELAQGFEPVRIPEIDFELVVERLLVSVLPWLSRAQTYSVSRSTLFLGCGEFDRELAHHLKQLPVLLLETGEFSP